MLDFLMEIFLKPVYEFIIEQLNSFLFENSFLNIFYFERAAKIDSSIINNLQSVICIFSIGLLTAKLLWKLFNIYIIGTDGDNTVSPFEYLKSFIKGIIIILSFTVVYGWLGDIVADFTSEISDAIGSGGFSTPIWAIGPVGIFLLIYAVTAAIFVVQTYLTGARMLFLRLAIPLSCVGLIDNDNGVYAVFMKKLMQNAITIVGQLALFQLSLSPISSSEPSFLMILISISILIYAMKLPQDLNEIFLAAPQTGSGQKLSAVGRGIQGAVSFLAEEENNQWT